MTALHRLVDAFGGHPVTRIPDADTPFLLCVRVEEEGIGHHILMVPAEMLSPIAPPLPPEPPIHTVLLSRKPNPAHQSGGPAEIVTVLWRDDAAASGDEFRWFSSHHGFEQSFCWVDVQPEPGETIVRLVPDLAASAPSLPWRVDAVDAVSLLVDRHGVDDPWARNGDAYIQLVAPGAGSVSRRFTAYESRALAAVLLAAADDQEAGQQ